MSTEKERETLYTIPQAAELTKIPVRTLYYAAKQGFLKTTPIAGKPFVTLQAIENWRNDPESHKPGRK